MKKLPFLSSIFFVFLTKKLNMKNFDMLMPALQQNVVTRLQHSASAAAAVASSLDVTGMFSRRSLQVILVAKVTSKNLWELLT